MIPLNACLGDLRRTTRLNDPDAENYAGLLVCYRSLARLCLPPGRYPPSNWLVMCESCHSGFGGAGTLGMIIRKRRAGNPCPFVVAEPLNCALLRAGVTPMFGSALTHAPNTTQDAFFFDGGRDFFFFDEPPPPLRRR